MSEQAPSSPGTIPPSTGLPVVDAVLLDLAVALALPVAEQAGAVERGHEQLRRVLDDPDQPV